MCRIYSVTVIAVDEARKQFGDPEKSEHQPLEAVTRVLMTRQIEKTIRAAVNG